VKTLVTTPALWDSVTLRHFAVAERLELARAIHEHRDPPRWSDAVSGEIAQGARFGLDDCVSVQECAWLGVPVEPEVLDLDPIWRFQVALSGTMRATSEHAGEAESIYFAERLGGAVVTDDKVAFDFARRRLGRARVYDTIDVLRDGVQRNLVSPNDAAEIAARISDSGRYLRSGRPPHPGATYFLMDADA
jgi:hypothetical protein